MCGPYYGPRQEVSLYVLVGVDGHGVPVRRRRCWPLRCGLHRAGTFASRPPFDPPSHAESSGGLKSTLFLS